jgi:hypothetical protein
MLRKLETGIRSTKLSGQMRVGGRALTWGSKICEAVTEFDFIGLKVCQANEDDLRSSEVLVRNGTAGRQGAMSKEDTTFFALIESENLT